MAAITIDQMKMVTKTFFFLRSAINTSLGPGTVVHTNGDACASEDYKPPVEVTQLCGAVRDALILRCGDRRHQMLRRCRFTGAGTWPRRVIAELEAVAENLFHAVDRARYLLAVVEIS